MTSTTRRTDAEPRPAVTQELDRVSDLDANHVGVSVTDRADTVSAEVGTHPEKGLVGDRPGWGSTA
ncbi:hypothetical protein RHODO2019_08520 [Rhodococcus antarcticus]|uniref:Uncharacterized protein n=1 Tax=Rhodococcus antarcticus TaxID=2987751 RepID=A0ABY6P422_9NOCA|nr:hypothetical protein [Rhodococcus antarcticus]UZJ26422.1 hypothetical protein RHODO2019_08520 [Rhodococcus antarcticus]